MMFSLALLFFGYHFFSTGDFRFYINGRLTTLRAHDAPLLFYSATTAVILVGIVLGVIAIRKVIRIIKGTEARSTRIETSPIWTVLNVGLGISVAVVSAAFSTATLPPIGAPLILATAIFVAMVVFAIVSARMADTQTLLRPSWNRSPFRSSVDPLQSLFMSTWFMACLLAGSALRTMTGDKNVLQLLPFSVAIFAGLIVGQLIVYVMNRDRIERK